MSLVKNTVTVGGFTLVSRIFGYIRDVLIAALLGASIVNDAFIVAFRLPNLFRAVFGEGALSVAFVPKFNEIKAKNRQKAKKFAAIVQAILVLSLVILTALFMIFMPYVVTLLAPGYIDNPEGFELIVHLSRITFPYILFISWAAFYGGILNSHGKFFPFAAAPVILNLVLIGACYYAYNNNSPGVVLSYAALLAGILEFLFVLYFAVKIGFGLLPIKPKIDDDINVMFRRLGVGIMSSGVMQINVWVSTILASFYIGGNSFIYYADRIYQLPTAVIGTALGTVVLPTLAANYAKKNIKAAKELMEDACFLGLFFAIPATFGIAYLANDVIEVLFQRGAFDVNDTLNTAKILFFFVFGIPGWVLYKVFTASFFARGDTRFPLRITMISTITNITISLSFFSWMGLQAIPIGAVAALYISVFLLYQRLKIDKEFKFSARLKDNSIKIIIAGLLMLIALMSFEYWLEQKSSTVELLLEMIFGGGIYLGSAMLLKLVKYGELIDILKFKRKLG